MNSRSEDGTSRYELPDEGILRALEYFDTYLQGEKPDRMALAWAISMLFDSTSTDQPYPSAIGALLVHEDQVPPQSREIALAEYHGLVRSVVYEGYGPVMVQRLWDILDTVTDIVLPEIERERFRVGETVVLTEDYIYDNRSTTFSYGKGQVGRIGSTRGGGDIPGTRIVWFDLEASELHTTETKSSDGLTVRATPTAVSHAISIELLAYPDEVEG